MPGSDTGISENSKVRQIMKVTNHNADHSRVANHRTQISDLSHTQRLLVITVAPGRGTMFQLKTDSII